MEANSVASLSALRAACLPGDIAKFRQCEAPLESLLWQPGFLQFDGVTQDRVDFLLTESSVSIFHPVHRPGLSQ